MRTPTIINAYNMLRVAHFNIHQILHIDVSPMWPKVFCHCGQQLFLDSLLVGAVKVLAE